MDYKKFISDSFPIFDNLASLLSVIGFFITLFIFFQMKEVKKSFLRKARLPYLLRDLETEKLKLYNILKQKGDFRYKEKEVLIILSTITAILENTEKKLSNDSKEKIKILISSLKAGNIKETQITEVDKSTTWKIHSELTSMIKHLSLSSLDSKFEK